LNLDLEHHHSFEFKPVGQFRGASLLQEQSADKKFVKYFLLTAKDVNGNGWGVSQNSIQSNIKDFIGQPLVATSRQFIADSEYGDTYTHPYIPTNHLPTIFAHQNKFAIGIIRDVVEEHGNWNAIAEIFPKYAHIKPPLFCSPGIFQLDPREPEGNISKWKALHLAVLDAEPAYGAQMAIMKGSCIGSLNECKVQFKGAKLEEYDCPYCDKTFETSSLKINHVAKEHNNDTSKTASVVCPIKLGQKLRKIALQVKFQRVAIKGTPEEIEEIKKGVGDYMKLKKPTRLEQGLFDKFTSNSTPAAHQLTNLMKTRDDKVGNPEDYENTRRRAGNKGIGRVEQEDTDINMSKKMNPEHPQHAFHVIQGIEKGENRRSRLHAKLQKIASLDDLTPKERLDLSTGEYGKYKRHDPELPLKNEVPFGKENRSVKQRKEDTKNKIMEGFESITNDTKIRPPKPTQKDRARIITAKFELISGLRHRMADLGEENMTYQDSKKVKIIKKKNQEDE